MTAAAPAHDPRLTCSPEYLAQLEAKRHGAAERAERIALGMLEQWPTMDDDARQDAHQAAAQAGHERDTYAQQIAWHRRRTGWAWPAAPAWND